MTEDAPSSSSIPPLFVLDDSIIARVEALSKSAREEYRRPVVQSTRNILDALDVLVEHKEGNEAGSAGRDVAAPPLQILIDTKEVPDSTDSHAISTVQSPEDTQDDKVEANLHQETVSQDDPSSPPPAAATSISAPAAAAAAATIPSSKIKKNSTGETDLTFLEKWPERSTAGKSDLEAGSDPTGTAALTELDDQQVLTETAPRSYERSDSVDSRLPENEDPFAPRIGKCLLWRNVNMTLVRYTVLYCTILELSSVLYSFLANTKLTQARYRLHSHYT